jgi:hypothetical protein
MLTRWWHGRMDIFIYRADLQTVMRQIARWYDVEISYEGKIPERQFGGKNDRKAIASGGIKNTGRK